MMRREFVRPPNAEGRSGNINVCPNCQGSGWMIVTWVDMRRATSTEVEVSCFFCFGRGEREEEKEKEMELAQLKEVL